MPGRIIDPSERRDYQRELTSMERIEAQIKETRALLKRQRDGSLVWPTFAYVPLVMIGAPIMIARVLTAHPFISHITVTTLKTIWSTLMLGFGVSPIAYVGYMMSDACIEKLWRVVAAVKRMLCCRRK